MKFEISVSEKNVSSEETMHILMKYDIIYIFHPKFVLRFLVIYVRG
jgi:hypothetical protein